LIYMTKNINISNEQLANAVARELIPEILYSLILKGKVDKNRYEDKEYLISIIKSYLQDTNDEYKLGVILYDRFLTWAKSAIDKNDLEVGLVLIVIAIEHILNLYLRKALELEMLENKDINDILKTNLYSKLNWLSCLVFGNKLSENSIEKVNLYFELRNIIVHYKHKATVREKEDNNYTEIKKKLDQINFTEALAFPKTLDAELETLLLEKDPDYRLAKIMYEVVTGK
jgi:hypothetical protein